MLVWLSRFATINGYVYAIAFYHRILGLTNPCASWVVVLVEEAGKRVVSKECSYNWDCNR